MFARLFAVASLAALVVAGPLAVRGGDGNDNNNNNTCNSGNVKCCNTVQDAKQLSQLLSPASLVSALADVTGLVALDCTPLSVLALSGESCTQQTVCCTGTKMDGLVNVGCTNAALPQL